MHPACVASVHESVSMSVKIPSELACGLYIAVVGRARFLFIILCHCLRRRSLKGSRQRGLSRVC